MNRFVQLALSLCCVLAPHAARAAGFAIPDLGAQAIGEGCARVAAPDDFSALYYNPAGLAGQGGLRLQFDSRATFHRVGFQRLDDQGNNPKSFDHITNTGGPTLLSLTPMGGVSWRWDNPTAPITFAIGGFPFNGATGYQYPDPVAIRAAGFTEAEVAVQTPQRYQSVFSGSKIYTVAFAAGARVLPWLDVGASFQLISAQIRSRLAVASGIVPGELTQFDAILEISGDDYFSPTGSFGFSIHPREDLHIGGAFQLGTHLNGAGALKADLTPSLEAAGAKLVGDQVDIEFNLPWIARLGVRYVRPAWEAELAGTLEGWHVFDEETITPHDVTVVLAGTSYVLPVLHLRKELHNAGSVRLGGLYRLGDLHPALASLIARLGGMVETSAVSTARQSLDLMHWGRGALGAGLGFHTGNLAIDFGYMHYFQPQRQVRDSSVKQTVALPDVAPTTVGNGDYDSNIDILSLSFAYRFD